MTLPHVYTSIPGFFDWPDLYKAIVSELPRQSHIVEIGCWLGSSTAFLAVEAVNSGKQIRIDVVDSFEGMDPALEPWVVKWIAKNPDGQFAQFRANMIRAGVWDSIRVVQQKSVAAAATYDDASLDFVYIDADHSYQAVKADIAAWGRKVKPGCVLAGHDYNLDGVKQAVDEAFGAAVRVEQTGDYPSWIVRR